MDGWSCLQLLHLGESINHEMRGLGAGTTTTAVDLDVRPSIHLLSIPFSSAHPQSPTTLSDETRRDDRRTLAASHHMPQPSYFARWASRIHPQLPLSTKDSQKLLRLLNTEFQKELDHRHPVSTELLSSSSSTAPVGRRSLSPSRLKRSPHESAASHLGSILTHPLFAWTEDAPGEDPRELHDPKPWFARKVARGTASMSSAKELLRVTLRRVHHAAPASRRAILAEERAGSEVLNWLRTSGLECSDEMKADLKFCRTLTPALVAEGRGDVVLRWLSSPFVPEADHASQSAPKASLEWRRELATSYVNAHRSLGFDVDAVIGAFLDCLESHKLAIRPAPPTYRSSQWQVFGSIGLIVTKDVLLAQRERAAIDDQKHASFVQSAAFWRRENRFSAALFSLYHRSTPDAEPLLRLLQDHFPFEYAERSTRYAGRISFPVVSRIPFLACVDAVELLASQGRRADASWILAHIQQNNTAHLSKQTDSREGGGQTLTETVLSPG